jgi:preprotein translocase subunit SecD
MTFVRFNIYLCLAAACLLAAGCKSEGDKLKAKAKDFSSLELYLEVPPDDASDNAPVPIYREHPILVNVNKTPFLDQNCIETASVVDEPGGMYHIRVAFNNKGASFLDMYTSDYRGKRMAIFSQFGQARWLASPVIRGRIADGVLTFTPDATHAESERIVKGLNMYAAELKKREKM